MQPIDGTGYANARPRVARAAVWLFVVACDRPGSSDASQNPGGAPNGVATERPTLAPAAPAPLSARCLLAGSDVVVREDSFYWIGAVYASSLSGCRTSVLVEAFDPPTLDDFAHYVGNYTSALFDCPLLVTPLPGGLDAFGPGNSDAVGVQSPLLGPDDAANLIDLYLGSVADEIAVGTDALAAMRGELERAALARIDSSSTGRLSTCP